MASTWSCFIMCMRNSGMFRICVAGQGCPQGSSASLCSPGVRCPGPAPPHPRGAIAQDQQMLSHHQPLSHHFQTYTKFIILSFTTSLFRHDLLLLQARKHPPAKPTAKKASRTFFSHSVQALLFLLTAVFSVIGLQLWRILSLAPSTALVPSGEAAWPWESAVSFLPRGDKCCSPCTFLLKPPFSRRTDAARPPRLLTTQAHSSGRRV